MALSGSIPLSPSAKAWSGEIKWEVSGGELCLSLYMWKTDGTGKPSSAGYTNSGSVLLNGSTVIQFSYDQIEYNSTQYGQTYKTSFNYGTSYTVSASISGLSGTAYAGTTLSGNGTIRVDRYQLSIYKDSGVNVSIQRISSDVGGTGSISSGAYLYTNDVLQINFSPLIGYDLTQCTVNGSAFTSGNTYTVSGTVSISATSEPKEYDLAIKAGIGSSITAYRQSTESSHASVGYLTSESSIYHDDKIKIIFDPLDGYKITTSTVNTNSFTSESVYTVKGDTSIESTADVKSYNLIFYNIDVGTEVIVYRIESPLKGASKTSWSLSNSLEPIIHENVIYHSDVLEVEFNVEPGYQLTQKLVNQKNFTSGEKHTVEDEVEIVTIAGVAGVVNIYDGKEFVKHLIYIYNGSSWDQYVPYIYNGSSWDLYS